MENQNRAIGSNQESNQAYNRALILRTLQHSCHCSRVELAHSTKLKQGTISNIINDFIDWRIVEETGSYSGTKGRRAIGLRLSGEKYRVIGFRLTRQHYTIGVFSLDCKENAARIHEKIVNSDPNSIMEKVCDTINSIINTYTEYTFLAVGVSVPGPYFQNTGEVAMISAFPGWRNIKIREFMQSHIKIPVIIDHDANAGALAESTLIKERDMYETMVYVSAGQGIGAGIVTRGEIYRGKLGIAGEIGHTCVDIHGALCECGRHGCLTLYASTIALTRSVRERLSNDSITYSQVIEMISDGQKVALEEFHKMMEYLGVGIIDILFNYNPSRIVVGDEISIIGQPILDELQRQIDQLNVPKLADNLKIELAQIQTDSAYVGAASIASRYVFENIGAIHESGILVSRTDPL